MRTSMAKSVQDLSSNRQFHWTAKVSLEDDHEEKQKSKPLENVQIFKTSLTTIAEEKKENDKDVVQQESAASGKKFQSKTLSRLRFVLSAFIRKRSHVGAAQMVGTLFGYRKGHVNFAFQKDSISPPVFLIELATPITGLVREMASGLVRIALECDRDEENKAGRLLLEEPLWRTFCNGKKSGFTMRRECGRKEMKILKALENISMGAGVLPGDHGEIMYMKANFERVVGSSDSEAFYMMNPDCNGAPELSIYLLRV